MYTHQNNRQSYRIASTHSEHMVTVSVNENNSVLSNFPQFFSEQKTSKNDKYFKIVWLFKSHRNIWIRKQVSHSVFSFLKVYQTYTLILFPWAPNIFYLFYNSLKHIYLGKVFFHTFHFAGWFSFNSYYQSWF